MLASNPAEAAAEAHIYLKEHSLVEYYDDVALKGIGLAAMDLRRGKLARERLPVMHEAIMELIDDLGIATEKLERNKAANKENADANAQKETGSEERTPSPVNPSPVNPSPVNPSPVNPSPVGEDVKITLEAEKSGSNVSSDRLHVGKGDDDHAAYVLCVPGRNILDDAAGAHACSIADAPRNRGDIRHAG